MHPSFPTLGLAASAVLLASCLSRDNTISRSAASHKNDYGRQTPDEQAQQSILESVWAFRDGREYLDRNGDGIVDWEATGADRYTDGFGVYKEDRDYDGYYDREYEMGGVVCTVKNDRKIREPVPPIHRIYPPTRTNRIPKTEQPGTVQPATRPVDEPEGSDKPQPEAEGRTP